MQAVCMMPHADSRPGPSALVQAQASSRQGQCTTTDGPGPGASRPAMVQPWRSPAKPHKPFHQQPAKRRCLPQGLCEDERDCGGSPISPCMSGRGAPAGPGPASSKVRSLVCCTSMAMMHAPCFVRFIVFCGRAATVACATDLVLCTVDL